MITVMPNHPHLLAVRLVRRTRQALALSLSLALALGAPAWADTPRAAPDVMGQARAAALDTAEWTNLTPSQRDVLAPLAAQWPSMEGSSRDKWIELANSYPHLSPAAQARIRSRMIQWAQVPAQQRGEARLRFQSSRQMSPQERQERWAAYQALTPEQRQDLTRQALRKQKPVVLADKDVGPREPGQLNSKAARSSEKANLVPGQILPSAKVVSPSIVKAGPGATTSLVSQKAAPPLHQHEGLPKISASTTFVDPQTMLPRKGSQSAAMTPVQLAPSGASGSTR
jgi:Protein of unknown function (DUF3106)